LKTEQREHREIPSGPWRGTPSPPSENPSSGEKMISPSDGKEKRGGGNGCSNVRGGCTKSTQKKLSGGDKILTQTEGGGKKEEKKKRESDTILAPAKYRERKIKCPNVR